jgi:predicted kinase
MKRSQAPIVIGLMGLPGAGKSRLAMHLVESTGWTLLDRDRLRRELFPDGRFDQTATRKAEEAMDRRMAEAVAAGRHLIMDGMTLARRRDRLRWAEWVRLAGGQWRLLFLDCPVDTAISRVREDREKSRHPAGNRDENLVREVAARLEHPDRDEEAMILRGRDCARAVLAWLGMRSSGSA